MNPAPYKDESPMPKPRLGGPITPAFETPVAVNLLRVAADHMTKRAVTYDQPTGERSLARTAAAFNAMTGRTGKAAITEAEAGLFMVALKNVRLFTAPGYHGDSAEDAIAYQALTAEAKQKDRA